MLVGICRKLIGLSGLAIMGAVTCAIRIITLDRGLEFNRMTVAPFICRITLRLVGVRVTSHIETSDRNVVYMFNHNSFLDLFLVPLAGLRNTRFIISEVVQKILPLHLANLGINVLYIPTKGDPVRRAQFFERVTQELADGAYSVICSPEGQHTFIHGLTSFNDGVFKMATESKRSIRCLFFDIPRDANPLESLEMKACHVQMHTRDLFETESWRVEDVTEHKAAVRATFLDYYKGHYGDFGDGP